MFPQYGRASGVAAYAGVGSPAVPTHGFLSHLHWTLVDAGGSDPEAEDPCPTVVLEAESTTETYAVWPFHFRAVYTVSTSHQPCLKSFCYLHHFSVVFGPHYCLCRLGMCSSSSCLAESQTSGSRRLSSIVQNCCWSFFSVSG